jgi:hypothetical protein
VPHIGEREIVPELLQLRKEALDLSAGLLGRPLGIGVDPYEGPADDSTGLDGLLPRRRGA